MTQVFDEVGNVIPVTVIEAGPCVVTQLKTKEKDGYHAIQVGYGTAKKLNKPAKGHLKEQNARYLREFRVGEREDYKVGDVIKVDIFKPGEFIRASGISVGKGFAGTVKRHHFSRGPMSHGSKSHRLPGSSGAGTSPGRVLPGTRRAGRMGGELLTVKSLKVIQVDPGKNLLLLAGAVPGKRGALLRLRKT